MSWAAAAAGLDALTSIYAADQQRAGQSAANATNIRIAREANAHSAQQAQINREFQQDMFAQATQLENTAVQRSVADMRAAGINPMLASGAPTAGTPSQPSGAMGQTIAARVENENAGLQGYAAQLGGAIRSGISSAMMVEQTQKVSEEILKIQAETADALNRAGISGTQLRQAEATIGAMQAEGGVFTMAFNESDHALLEYMRKTVTQPAVQAQAARMAQQSNEEALQNFINMPAANALMAALQMALKVYLASKPK